MSYQPSPLASPALAPGAAVPRRGRSRWVLGAVLIVAGVAGGAALYAAQRSSYETAVTNLQRAASGLSTEFVFEKEGVFTLYYEYKGEFAAEVDGDDEDIELDARSTPRQISLRLVDADGERVRLDRDVPDVAYDVAGFGGSAYRQVEIDDTGSYVLEVASETGRDEFAIAVGIGIVEEPNVIYPAILAIAGILLGLLAVLVVGRRRTPAGGAHGPVGPPAAVGSGPPLVGWPPAAPAGPPPAPTWGAGESGASPWAPAPPPSPAAAPAAASAPSSPAPSPSWEEPAGTVPPAAPTPDPAAPPLSAWPPPA